MSTCNGLLVIAIKLKAKKKKSRFLNVVILHSAESKTWTEVSYPSMLCYHTKFQNPVSSGTSIAPTSEVRKAAMLVLLTVVN